MTRCEGALPAGLALVAGLALTLGGAMSACGGDGSSAGGEPAATASSGGESGADDGGEAASGSDARAMCEHALSCCYAYVAVMTENRPEDRSTCLDLADFPTDGSGAADNCAEMISGWQQAIAEAQRSVPECQ